MNSNRMKYASTPTFGMQKRGFAKKPAQPQSAQTPDFTKQSQAFGSPFPPQQSVYPPSAMPMPGAYQQPNPAMMGSAPFAAYPQTPVNPPLASNPPAYPQGYTAYAQPQAAGFTPLGNSASASAPVFTPGMQGFVPPAAQAAPAAQPSFSAYPESNPFMPPVSVYARSAAQQPMAQPANLNQPILPIRQAAPPQSPMMPVGTQPVVQPAPMNAPFAPRYPAGGEAKPTPRPPIDKERLYKAFLFGLIPLLFIPCLFVSHAFDWLRYAFVATAVIGLSVMWYRQMLSPSMRTVLSVVYVALCVISLSLLLGDSKDVTQTSASLNQPNSAPAATASPVPGEETALPAEAPVETPAPTEAPGHSDAAQRRDMFMGYWSVSNYESMVALVQPSWASTRENANAELFQLLANRVPKEYEIEEISGTATDSSRTVTMTAVIDKNNGKDPVKYRFMILMVKEGDYWYVDPQSLATNDVATEDTSADTAADGQVVSQTLAPRMTQTPVPSDDTTLYYNASGGSYYHADPECSKVNKKYLPLSPFKYGQLGESPFNKLEPCLACGAPTSK